MSAAAPRGGSSDALERLLDALLSAEQAAQWVEAAARSLAEISCAGGAAIFLFEEGRPTLEGWHPATLADSPQACPLRTLAREAMGLPLGPESAHPVDPQPGLARLPLVFRARTMGYALLVPGDLPLDAGAATQRAVRAVASFAGAESEMVASQGAHARYQRWFKTLDEQLRVLDRERQ